MKRPGLAYLFLFLALCLAGCKKGEISVEFELSPEVDGAYSLIYYASDKARGLMIENVLSLQKGKAVTKCPTIRPELVYLRATSGRDLPAVFYAERGDKFKITGKGADPTGWKITGNKITDALSEWRLDAKEAFEKRRSNPERGAAALNAQVVKYVKGNPESPVSTILLLTYYDRRRDEAGFAKAWKMLKGDAADQKWVSLVSRGDFRGELSDTDKLPSQLVFKTAGTGCDTLKPGKVPALLYFTRSTVSSYRTDIDRLRDLSREFKDSSSRVIVDISFEPDSSARAYKLRADSLKGTWRAWMPLGVNDALAEKLGVKRIPTFIVIDKKGKVSYRGGDAVLADSLFRKAMR